MARDLLRDADVLAVVAAGGALGATVRWAAEVAVPQAGPDRIPWATFTVNVVGCLLMGVLMWFVLEAWGQRRYARPFLGVGVLGGFTTFSAYAAETYGMADAGAWLAAAAYVAGTVVAGLLAVRAGYLLGRVVSVRRD